MRMNRGILALGIVATVATVANVYATIIFNALLCSDSCSSLGATLTSGQPQTILGMLIPLALLFPSVTLTLAGWVWELVDLRRMGAGRQRAFVAWLPVIAILVGVAATLLTGYTSQSGWQLYPFNTWFGSFALALWPLLLTLVAVFWRRP